MYDKVIPCKSPFRPLFLYCHACDRGHVLQLFCGIASKCYFSSLDRILVYHKVLPPPSHPKVFFFFWVHKLNSRDLIMHWWTSSCWKTTFGTELGSSTAAALVIYILTSSSPVSPHHDQHIISPCNINISSSKQVMRKNDMIIRDKMPWCFTVY